MDHCKSVPIALARRRKHRFVRRTRSLPLASPLQNPAAATDLISFLKALPDCRMRRGIRFPQWWMLLVATLSILSGQGSLLGMERFAKRHRKTLNELLGTQATKPPTDSTFRLLLAQLGWRALRACCSSGWGQVRRDRDHRHPGL